MALAYRLLALLRPHTAEGAAASTEARLLAFRALWVLTGLSIFFTAAVYPLAGLKLPRDPLWSRVVVGSVPLVLFALSYVSAGARRHFAELTYVLLYALMAWSVALTALHAFSADYAVWLLFSFGALGIAHSIGLTRAALLAAFLTYAVALASVAVLLTPHPMVQPVLFIGCLVCFAAVLYLALAARKLAEENLIESEERNRAVLRQTADGVCLVDVETHHFVETNPAFRAMVGYTSAELRARTIHDLVPEPTAAVRVRIEHLLAAEGPIAGERTFRRKDGTRVEVGFGVNEISYDGKTVLCVVTHDIQEQKQTERALRRAKARAEETARAKAALLNNVSHELRTPLAGILGFADVLAEEIDGEHREFARLIAKNGRRLQETIRSVMDLAKLESTTATLDRRALDLAGEVRDVADLLAPGAQERGLYLNVVARTPVCAWVDRAALARILYNVIGNALKFTRRGGVTVTLGTATLGTDDATGGPAACLRVRDTGIGMDEAFLPHLFDEFKQESAGLARSHQGVGIGLTITKRLVDLMDGQIAVESKKGGGTTVTLHFPLRPLSPKSHEQPLQGAGQGAGQSKGR